MTVTSAKFDRRGAILLLTIGIAGCTGAPTHQSVEASKAPLTERLAPEALRCLGVAIPPLPDDGASAWVVILVSPRMVYSLSEVLRMQRVAGAMGFGVKLWRDPAVSEGEWRGALSTKLGAELAGLGIEALPAACLPHWAPINHWPYSRVVWRETVHNWPIWGVMPSAAWQETLRNRLDVLQREAGPSARNNGRRVPV